ncbi:MAG: hypothetical protein R6U63_11555 [Longimicrobiales bacterium]
MTKTTVAVLAVALLGAGCDLPTSADEARERLGKDQEERIVPIQLPLPSLSVTLADELGDLSDIVDTTDLSFSVDPDTFAFAMDSLLTIDPVDPDPVSQGYVIDVADFTQDINVTLPAVPITLPSFGQAIPLPLTGFGTADSATIELDLSGTFTDATFASGSALQVALATDATSTVTDVTASIQDAGGTELAASPDTISLGTSSSGTVSIDLSGVTLPATFDVKLSWSNAESTAPDGDELTIDISFVNAEVTAASGVDATKIDPVTFTEAVTLDQTGADFSQATLAAGTVAVDSFSSGTLEFTPDFDGDLSGLQVGGTNPDSLVVGGTVGPPAGAATVDVENTASLTIAFTGLEVESVTLTSVSMEVDQTVTIAGTDSTLNDLREVVIDRGTLEIDIANRLGVDGTVTLTLNGAVDSTGAVITSDIAVQPSPDGSPVVTSAVIDLADVVLTPDSLEPRITGTIGGTDVTVTPAAAADAVTVDPYLAIQPRSVILSGLPADLSIALDERVSIAATEIDLDEMSDLVSGIDFNDVSFTVTLDNGTGLDLKVDGFRMTLLDSLGAPVLSGTDTVRVDLSNDTSGAVLIPAAQVTTVAGDAHRFVNALLDEIAAGRDVEMAAGGVAGPAADSGSMELGDSLTVIFEIALGPDITIDPSGISFDQVVADAIDLDSIAGEFLSDLSEDLVSASVEFEAINGMPLGMAVRMALAPTPADTTGFDPFTASPRISLPTFSFGAGIVDSTGRVTASRTDTASASVNPSELSILAEGLLGMGLEATLTGPEGNRAVLQPADSLVLRPLLKLEIRVGGSAGGNQ